MKAITLHQPWATLMALGAKRIETRSWPTHYRGPLAIHAGKTLPAYARETLYARSIQKALGWPELKGELYSESRWGIHAEIRKLIESLPLGCIVATCKLVNCLDTDLIPRFVSPFTEQERMFGNYDPGRFGWLTEDLYRIDPPIPVVGARGLWDWDASALPASSGLRDKPVANDQEAKC